MLNGDRFHLAEHVGREAILLNFFATWCGPCREEMPEFERLAQRMSKEPLRIVAVDAQETHDLVDEFVHKLGIKFAVGIDASGDVLKAYGVDSYPTTVLIGADGKIKLYEVGPILNADVSLLQPLRSIFDEIREGRGISAEEYLRTARAAAAESPRPHTTSSRAKRIAEAMACPCGCDQKVAVCGCSTAKSILRRLEREPLEGREDADVIRALDREFCVGASHDQG